MSVCGICHQRRQLGNCSFGGGKIPVSPHCKGCCTDADGDKWRPVRAAARKSQGKRPAAARAKA